MYQNTVSQAQDPSSKVSSYKALSSDTILGVNKSSHLQELKQRRQAHLFNYHLKFSLKAKDCTVKKLP